MNLNNDRPTRRDIQSLMLYLAIAKKGGYLDDVLDHELSGWDPKAAVDFSRMLATIASEIPQVDPNQLDDKERRLLKGRIRRARKALMNYREWLHNE